MTPPSMNVSEVLKDDRQLRSLIGLGLDEFQKLLDEFTPYLKENQSKNRKGKLKKRRQRKIGGGRKSVLSSPENQLLFILILSQNYPTYDVLAFMFNISRGCAFESVQRLLPILKNAQKNLKVLPKRTTDDPQELLQLIESVDHILSKFSLTAGKRESIKIILHIFQYVSEARWATYLHLMSNYHFDRCH
jgi:hypothetical protein